MSGQSLWNADSALCRNCGPGRPYKSNLRGGYVLSSHILTASECGLLPPISTVAAGDAKTIDDRERQDSRLLSAPAVTYGVNAHDGGLAPPATHSRSLVMQSQVPDPR